MARANSPPTNPNVRDPKWRLVRLKTVNPKRGIHMRKWSAAWRGQNYTIQHDKGWYWVPVSLASYLETVPARHGALPGGEGDEDHARGFIIKDCIAAAKACDDAERLRDKTKTAKNDPTIRINGGGQAATGGSRRYDEREEGTEGELVEGAEVFADADVVNAGDLDTEIMALERRLEELKSRAAQPKEAEVAAAEHVEGGDSEPTSDANPDLNTEELRRKKVDFKAEGDQPTGKKTRLGPAAPGAAKKNATPPARVTTRGPGARSLRPGD